ncbi:MAG: xanthine dehydrogenase family protein molybdopterin-binding subunit [Gammaproteobacteria bacterium]|nr:xanthine dehydrogenase family protein molybdopterin-binding subunit [Gammaproteobacteria bacterium]
MDSKLDNELQKSASRNAQVTDTVESFNSSRRSFLKLGAGVAGVLAVGMSVPMFNSRAIANESQSGSNIIDIWLTIDKNDVVTIAIANSEMGQGVYTSLAMLVAEELEVDWNSVQAAAAPAAPEYKNLMFGMQATGGSTSIRWAFDPLRTVGAAARQMLVQAAADQWGVAPTECTAANATVSHSASGRSLRYGELVEAAAQLVAPSDVTLKTPDQWRLLGTPAKRLDTPAKVNGSAVFGIDVQVPNMLTATVAACPTFGGKLSAVDDSKAMAIRGVQKVLPLEDAVVVVADSYWSAKKGLAALKPQWDYGSNAGRDTESYRNDLKVALGEEAPVAHDQGDALAVLAESKSIIQAMYEVPHLAHATMEPMNATVSIGTDSAEIWAPTQGPGIVQQVAAGILQLPMEAITVHTTFLGGGFGRKFEMDFIVQALLTAKLTGSPVKLIWSREEDTQHDFYRPASMSEFQAVLGEDGYPVVWHNRIACPSIMTRVFPNLVQNGIDPQSVEGAHELPYNIENQRIEYQIVDTGVPVGFWRAVGNSQNAWFVQSFVDELAAAAGIDPYEYQQKLLAGQDRHLAVLKNAVTLANWSSRSSDKPMGLSVHHSFGSYCAMVVELDPDVSTRLKIRRISAAIDCGQALNPDTVVAQIESSIVYGLTAAFYGDIEIENGAVIQSNFPNYPMLTLAQMPVIDVEIVNSGEAVGGIGEPGLPPLAPALTNAIFAATGERVRRLPLVKSGYKV